MARLSKIITTTIQRGNKTLFDIPRLEEESYLRKLGPAKDDYDRSYKQYKCQNYFMPPWKVVIINIFAFFFLLPTVIYLVLKRTIVNRQELIQAIGEFKGITEIIPDTLQRRYKIVIAETSRPSLSVRDLSYVLQMALRYPLAPYFTIKCTLKLGGYSQSIYCHHPDAIIVHNEPSFTISVLTNYCNKKGVKHINVMHGEKLFFIRDSYFRFDECYVWSEHYVRLFTSMNAAAGQFIIEIPHSLKIDTQKYINKSDYADYKYYLAIYNEEEIRSIVESLSFVGRNGETVKFRPHPRYSNIKLLEKYVGKEKIENPNEVSILSSISNLKYAVGSFTTVLSQAYFSGKGVICDDVTFSEQYKKLKDLKYILASMPLPKLSDFQ